MGVLVIGFMGLIGALMAIIAYGTLTWALVFHKFYYWFILSAFPTFSVLTYVQCMGIILFLGVITRDKSDRIKKEYKDESYTKFLIGPWIVLLVGWIFKLIFF